LARLPSEVEAMGASLACPSPSTRVFAGSFSSARRWPRTGWMTMNTTSPDRPGQAILAMCPPRWPGA